MDTRCPKRVYTDITCDTGEYAGLEPVPCWIFSDWGMCAASLGHPEVGLSRQDMSLGALDADLGRPVSTDPFDTVEGCSHVP